MDIRETIRKLQTKADDRSVGPEERRLLIDKINELRKKYEITTDDPPKDEHIINVGATRAGRRDWEDKLKDSSADITYGDIHLWRHRNPNIGSTNRARGPDVDSLYEEGFKYEGDVSKGYEDE